MVSASGGLKRRLGTGLLTLYGVGIMVGAGIYVLVGAVAGAAGALAPLVFVVAALVVLPTVLSYAELAGRFPESAGEAAYLDKFVIDKSARGAGLSHVLWRMLREDEP
ncbi:MAG: amino acid permease, partial [Pseudomonadota bacterium]